MTFDKTINPKKDITINFKIEWPIARGLRFLVAKGLLKLTATIMPIGCRVIIANG